MIHRRNLVLLPLATAAAAAMPQTPPSPLVPARRFGAISVVGDQLTVVAYQPSTGTTIPRNERWPVPIRTTEIDDAALLAVRGGLPAAAASSGVAFYRVPAESFATWQRLADTGAVELPSDVAAALARDGVTHLLLVARLRAPASIQLANGRVGSGTLEGLGFYLDHGMEVRTRESGVAATGFIAPYAYLRVALIDLAARRVLGQETVRSASGHSAATSRTGRDPWEALTPDEKSRLIAQILEQEVGAAVGRLAGRP